MSSPLMKLYEQKKDMIEKLLSNVRNSDVCRDYGNFASVRRRPMLETLIYYLQKYASYKKGVLVEEIKAFLYCMYLAEIEQKMEKVILSIIWCPIEQTLDEISGRVLKRYPGESYFVSIEQFEKRKIIYWDVLDPLFVIAKKICEDILNPPDNRIKEMLSLSPSILSKSKDMRDYLNDIRLSIESEKQRKLSERKHTEAG